MGHSSSTSVDRCRHRRLPSDPSGGTTTSPPVGSSRGTAAATTVATATRFQAKLAVLAVAAALLATLSPFSHRSGDSAAAPSSSGATADTPRGSMTTGADDGSPATRIVYSAVPTEGETRGSPTLHVRYIAYEVVGTDTASPTPTGVKADDDERRGQKPLSVRRWADVLSSSGPAGSEARVDFLRIVRDCPYGAVFLETKGASDRTADSKQFEFVLLDAPYLKRFAEGSPDPHTFAEHLNCGGDGGGDEPEPAGCTFPSLGGDATLVAPRRPAGETGGDVPDSAYSHLAAFVRGVPMDRAERFWRLVVGEYGRALTRRETVWLSTDGTGVAWLHVRLDSRPKYYKYEEFAGAT